MQVTIRTAGPADIEGLAALMLADAEGRCRMDPGLWRMAAEPGAVLRRGLEAAMAVEAPAVRQGWLIAEAGGQAVGAGHWILLPVPPIYAGRYGPPGLIMEDCCLAPGAPEGTAGLLRGAVEAALVQAGARILLGSSVTGGPWEAAFLAAGYRPLTVYYARLSLRDGLPGGAIRAAGEADLPGIVAASAVHRRVLAGLHPAFWEPHAEADARFGAWMARSLTLGDRDMLVAGQQGYAVAQPATALHFPAPHDIGRVAVIDDFHHAALEDPARAGPGIDEAAALFAAAEGARARRGDQAVLVVCPADWASKRRLLEGQGYRPAITWFVRFLV